MLGCDEKTIRRHCSAKPPAHAAPHTRLKNGQIRVDAGELAAWGRTHNINFRPGRPSEAGESPDLEAVRIRKETAMAENWEHRNSILKADHVPVADVKALWGERVAVAKNKLIGLGAAVAPQCEGHDAGTIQGIIEHRVNNILVELSGTTE